MKKINITQEQLDEIEFFVVSYMIAAENEIRLSLSDRKSVILGIDVKWDDSFNVIKEPK